MSLNNVRAVGDDQDWKDEVERVIAELRREILVLKSQLGNRG